MLNLGVLVPIAEPETVPVNPHVELLTCAVVTLGGEQILARTLQVSTSGLTLTCQIAHPAGSRIQVELRLPNRTWVCAHAWLISTSHWHGAYLWRVHFVSVPKPAWQHLTAYVEARLA